MIKSKINTEKDLYEQLKAIREAFGNNIAVKLFVIDKDVLVVGVSRISRDDLLETDTLEESDISTYKNYFG
jgi:hypothetical protein